MTNLTVGFRTNNKKKFESEITATPKATSTEPRKSVVFVYFPSRGMGWSYYNDRFDLKVGDIVYVDGKLEGHRGQVSHINYSFKIKISDYKKVIAVVDTNVNGNFCINNSHLVTFDRDAIPFDKVKSWFMAPDNSEDYAIGNDDSDSFPLNDLDKINIPYNIHRQGQDCFSNKCVNYISVDGTHGYAIVTGSKSYEIEFDFADGEISDLKCSCYCSCTCKHQYAAILQLKELINFIKNNCDNRYCNYFAAVSKDIFMDTVMNGKDSGKFTLGI